MNAAALAWRMASTGISSRWNTFVILMLVALLGMPAHAQDFPNRPISVVVPFAAGGPSDVIARILTEHMSRTLRQPMIIENVPGAGGTTGVARAAKAARDGYTILLGHMGTHAAAVGLYPNLPYDPLTDFSAIGLTAGTPVLILGKKDLAPRTLKEFITYITANSSKMNQAHGGVGSISHLSCVLLNSILRVDPVTIPFSGSGPALNALVGGQVDYLCGASGVSQVTAGVIKAYAITTAQRNPVLPDVPTTAESGLPEFEVSAWNGLFAPRGTPSGTVSTLADALDKALDDPAVRKRLLDLASDIPTKDRRGPQFLDAYVKREVERWAPIARAMKH